MLTADAGSALGLNEINDSCPSKVAALQSRNDFCILWGSVCCALLGSLSSNRCLAALQDRKGMCRQLHRGKQAEFFLVKSLADSGK